MKKTCLMLLLSVLGVRAAQAAIATQSLNYQGQLTDLSDVAMNGTANIAFELYPTLTGGSPVWSQAATAVPLTRGLFNVDLNVSALGSTPAVLNGTLFLEVTVNGQTLSPRKQVLAGAFALNSDRLQGYEPGNAPNKIPVLDSLGHLDPSVASAPFPLSVSGDAGAASASVALSVLNSNLGAGQIGVRAIGADAALSGSASVVGGSGVVGSTAASDNASANGVWGRATNGVGVRAASGAALSAALVASNTAGTGIYGYGKFGGQFSASTLGLRIGGAGLAGQAGQTPATGLEVNSSLQGIVVNNSGANAGLSAVGSGSGPAVEGIAQSANAVGVRGEHNGSGFGVGVFGISSAPGGVGVRAENSSLTGTGAALKAIVSSPSSVAVDALAPSLGVRGVANGLSGQTFGVRGQADAADGQALRGDAGGLGAAYGVYASAPNSASGAGVYGTSAKHGVWGQSTGSGTSNYGVYGVAAATALRGESTGGGGSAYGVYGSSASTTGIGVYGLAAAGAPGTAMGVQGVASDPGSTGVYGLGVARGVAGKATGGQGHGVEGDAGPAGAGDGRAGVYGSAVAGSNELVYGVYASVSGPSASAYGIQSKASMAQGKAAILINYAAQTSDPGYALDVEGKFKVGLDNAKVFIASGTATSWTVASQYVGAGDIVLVTPQMDITNGGTVANAVWVGNSASDVNDGFFVVRSAAPITNFRFQYLVIDK